MAMGKSIRIYDLAREVKQDTKRVMEDLRREGADVSVASNSVPFEIAEKVRSKYFPKTEIAPKRAIKVIKAVAKAADEVAEAAEEVVAAPAEPTLTAETPAKPARAAEEVPSKVKKLSLKEVASPEPVAETPPPPTPVETKSAAPATTVKKVLKLKATETTVAEEPAAEIGGETTVEAPTDEIPLAETPTATPEPEALTGTRIKRMTLSAEALKKGIKAGDRVVSEAPTRTGSLIQQDRGRPGAPGQFRGTPGENAAPQMTYTPPADSRRRPGRGGGRKGRAVDDKTGRFGDRDDAPQKRSIEERILDQVGKVAANKLKAIRTTEGATVHQLVVSLSHTPRSTVQ